MKKIPAFVTLTIITLVAAALLAGTNEITKEHIAAASEAATYDAHCSVLADADAFEHLGPPEGVDTLCVGKKGDAVVGYVATVTAKGYGGPIQIIVGVDLEGNITGISVGGSDFAETAGLGSRVKDESFTSQFVGLTAPISLGDGVDGISGATVSSRAVAQGVNTAVEAALSVQ